MVLSAVEFISRLLIIDKQGNIRQLKLNQEQLLVLEALEAGYNLIIPKARQIGITTIIRAYHFWKTYTANYPIKCAAISHKRESSDEINKMDVGFYDRLPKLLQWPLSKRNTKGFTIKKNGASIKTYTAGGKGGLRSFSVTDLHITEFCFFEDPDELLATALAALNGGQCVIESTAQAYGDPMHQLVDRIRRGDLPGKWKLLFFPWYLHEEYSLEVEGTLQLTTDEQKLVEEYSLTQEQIAWRRNKIQEIGIAKFLTEYPACFEDIFSQKEDVYYIDNDLANVVVIPLTNKEEVVLAEPNPKDKYALGVDVASGVGKDYSVIFVLSKLTNQPVYIYRSNRINTDTLAAKIENVSLRYNNAKTLVEANNYGWAVLNELKHLNFNNLWKHDADKDWVMTQQSKLLMHEALKKKISSGVINQLDEITVNELRALKLPAAGKAPESVRGATGHSDNVIALGLASQCLDSVFLDSQRKNLFQPPPKKPANMLDRRY